MKSLFFLFLSLPLFLFGQRSTRLNNGWQFLKQDLGGIWEAIRPAINGNPESVPFWENVELPHCFNSTDAVAHGINYYQGPGWYRTRINIKNPYENGRTLLHFEGAGQKTVVYVNDQKVGDHIGGYDEFTIDITDAVTHFKKDSGQNKLVPIIIRCDNSRDLQMIPSNLSDFTIYGGLYRYLNLVYVPATYIERMAITPIIDIKSRMAKCSIKLQVIGNIDAEAFLKIAIKAPDGQLIISKTFPFDNKKALPQFSIDKAILWDVKSPQLYRVTAVLISGIDSSTYDEHIGFRQASFIKKGPFELNGKRLLLKGTHRHEDHAGVGAAMTESMIRDEMIMMKKMGVNFIRLGHYQQSRIVLNLCDSLGILVWEEIPWCRGGLGGLTYKEQAKRMLTNMITQHYNHPSVMLWGLGNENDWPGDFETFSKDSIRMFMKELNALAHSTDTTRLTSIRRCDFCSDIVDVYSPSIWAGWYRGIYTEYKKISEEEFNKVDRFIHVEWGGDSHAGRNSEKPDQALLQIATGNGGDERSGDASLYGGAARASRDGDWSESYIIDLFDWHLKEQETMPWLTGTAAWIFKDFATPIRPDNPVPYVNQKGVVERNGHPKESYYVFQSYWSEEPMIHIYGHNWPVRWGGPDEKKLIKVFSNCEAAELFLNGKSLGTRKRDSQNFPAAGLRWETTFVEGKNHVVVTGVKGKFQVRDTIDFIYQTAKWNKPVQLSLNEVTRDSDTIQLQALALDENGTLALDARNVVHFNVTGDATLIADMGTVNASSTVQLANGRASISLRYKAGQAAASVTSDGMKTSILLIKGNSK